MYIHCKHLYIGMIIRVQILFTNSLHFLGLNEYPHTPKSSICQTSSACTTASYCLKLPGKNLNLTALLYAKKFRAHGYKAGAMAAFTQLEAEELGKITTSSNKAGKVCQMIAKNQYITRLNFVLTKKVLVM